MAESKLEVFIRTDSSAPRLTSAERIERVQRILSSFDQVHAEDVTACLVACLVAVAAAAGQAAGTILENVRRSFEFSSVLELRAPRRERGQA